MQHQFLTPEPMPVLELHASAPEIQAEDSETQTETDLAADQAQTQAVAALLTAAKRKIRRRKIKFWSSFALLECANLPLIVPDLLGFHFVSHAVFMMAFVGMLITAVILMFWVTFSPIDFDAEELARLGGVRAIPPLLDALNSGTSRGVRKTLYRVLTRLLPQMRATDANLLTVRHRQMLNYILNAEVFPGGTWGMEPGFIPAVLKAYEQIGDAKAVPVVTRLANKKARTERQRAVQQAARECLPLLQANTVPLASNQTLLRAADPFQTMPDTLLRPSIGTTAAPDEELLRPSTSEPLP